MIVERRMSRRIHVVGRPRRCWQNVGAVRLHVPVRSLRWGDSGHSYWTLVNVWKSVKGARWHRHDDVAITKVSGRHRVSLVRDNSIVVGVRVVRDDDWVRGVNE